MTIRNLQQLFRPKSIAVIGASTRARSVGRKVLENVIGGGFEGEIYPVNPKYGAVLGLRCYAHPSELPKPPELAIIVTPSQTVPALISDLGARGTKAAVVLTAGLTVENGLRQQMLDAARPHLLRIVGPNTLGILSPVVGLNASFAHRTPEKGKLALLSQSGAIATALIDWAADENIGFSHIVSLGDMADVDVADCMDMLARDHETDAILMYLESIPHPLKFMSAARAAARLKPVIAIKSGRHEAAAKAAATHTGALSGADRVVDAALRRAGVLRVQDLSELFLAAETLFHFPPIEDVSVGIITNGGGAGVLAVDQLADENGSPAVLSSETLARLDAILPATWSHANPVDIIGDASPDKYSGAAEIVAADPNVNALLIMNCPTALASPVDAAKAVTGIVRDGLINGKPVLACWLGEASAQAARRILQQNGVASYRTPAEASKAIMFLNRWTIVQESLRRVPSSDGEQTVRDPAAVAKIFRRVAAEGRRVLTEPEAKAVVGAYSIPVPDIEAAATPDDVNRISADLLNDHHSVVVKLLSKKITHKSDVGGVVLNITSADAAQDAAFQILDRVKQIHPDVAIEGFAVQPMIRRKGAHELIIGVSRDSIFGPVMMFGAGGTAVEVMDDTAMALPPLDSVLGGDLIDQTRIGKLLKGYRDRPAADRTAILATLNAVSQLVVDFPCIDGIDLNPLLADENGVVALDARIEIDFTRVAETGPNRDLAIRPYPSGWRKRVELQNGAHAELRPIRPDDIALYPDFLARTAPEDIRMRLLAPQVRFRQTALTRLTQLDYDREMAFVALSDQNELLGIARIAADPDHRHAEYGLIVRTDIQGQGLGWLLLEHLIAFARADGLKQIEGVILTDNRPMISMCREFGFHITMDPESPTLMRAVLELTQE